MPELTMKKDGTTRLIHSDARIPEGYRSLATPTSRGSVTRFTAPPSTPATPWP